MSDVIIIGAGAAGLAAAQKLTKANKSITILEARGRLGGRIFTRHPKGVAHAVELGAEFIHGLPDEVLEIIPQLKQSLVYEVADYHHKLKTNTLVEMKDAWKQILKPLKGLKRASKHDRSLQDVLNQTQAGSDRKKMAKSFIEGFDAADARKISAYSLKNLPDEMSGDGAKMSRIANGYDQIISHLSCGVKRKIHLNTVVNSIHWKKNRVRVTANQGKRQRTWVAPKVIITVPVGVLKAPPGEKGAIEFHPALTEKSSALVKMEMGSVLKMVLLFDPAVWPRKQYEKDINFIHFNASGPFQVLWSYSPVQLPIFTVWAGGPAAEKMDPCTEEEILTLALQSISSAFKMKMNFLKTHLKKHFLHHWRHDPFARGAYSYIGVDGANAQKILAKPISNTLYFAGEALHMDGQTGTVDAAIASGYKAARSVLGR